AGTMDAARLGVLVSLLVFTSASSLNKMLVAFAFALLGTFISMKILEKIRCKDRVFSSLVALMFGSIISSIATCIAYRYDLIQNMTSSMQGDFSMIMTGNYELMFITVSTLIFAYFYANKFTIAGRGEDFSKNLGLNYRQVVNLGLMIAALVTASVVLSVGMI